jgi:hypothetical protein
LSRGLELKAALKAEPKIEQRAELKITPRG